MKQKPPPVAMAPAVAANKVSIPRPHPLRKTVSKEQLSNIRSRKVLLRYSNIFVGVVLI